MKVQRAIVVFLTSAWALASHFKVLCQSFFYVMGKVLSGELSYTGTGLVQKDAKLSNSYLAKYAIWIQSFQLVHLFICGSVS